MWCCLSVSNLEQKWEIGNFAILTLASKSFISLKNVRFRKGFALFLEISTLSVLLPLSEKKITSFHLRISTKSVLFMIKTF